MRLKVFINGEHFLFLFFPVVAESLGKSVQWLLGHVGEMEVIGAGPQQLPPQERACKTYVWKTLKYGSQPMGIKTREREGGREGYNLASLK